MYVVPSTIVSLYMFSNLMVALSAFKKEAGILVDGDHLTDFMLWSEDKSLHSLILLGIDFFHS